MKTTMKVVALSVFLLVLTVFLTWSGFRSSETALSTPQNSQTTLYPEKYFDRNNIMQIQIEIAEKDWKDMIANAMKEEFHEANVTVNGDFYPLVMIRPKGNSSLSTISKSSFNEESSMKRFSLKINFNELNKTQTMAGLTQLNLNNGFADPSLMREYLGYQIFEKMGVKVPAFSYADVYINGEYFGLFLAVESILEPYLERNFGNTTGVLYKSDGNTLKYTGDIASDTSGLQIKSGEQNADKTYLMNFLEVLNQGGDIEKYLDIDQALRYIAVSTALINMDSYQGNFAHNYYLYEQEGKFTFLPWDLNMAFGGFNFNGDLTKFFIDEPTQGALADKPFIAKLLEVEAYRARYHTYLQEIIDKYLNKTYLQSELKRLISLISLSVMKDPTSLYTYQDFTKNTSMVVTDLSILKAETEKEVDISAQTEGITTASLEKKKTVRAKASFSQNTLPLLSLAIATAEVIQKQLNGEVPSTNDGKGMEGGMGAGHGMADLEQDMPPASLNGNREGNFQPPDGEMGRPLRTDAIPPMGGQIPEGNPGMPFGEGGQMSQNSSSRTAYSWLLAGGSATLLLLMLFIFLLPKRKWIRAG